MRPNFLAADVGFTRQTSVDQSTGRVQTILWHADPLAFVARYPDSDVEYSYGSAGPPHCLDWWLNFEDADRVRIEIEGWNLPDLVVDVSPHGLRFLFGRLLDVSPVAQTAE